MVLDVIAWLLIGLVAFNWFASWRLWVADRQGPIAALRERTIAQIVLSVGSVAWGVLGLITLDFVPSAIATPLLVIAAFANSVPAAVWLYMDRRGW